MSSPVGARIFILLDGSLSPLLHIMLIALSAVGGMFWGFVVGFLKIRLGVNEIFGGVALNALVNVISTSSPAPGNRASAAPPKVPAPALLPEFSPTFPVNM